MVLSNPALESLEIGLNLGLGIGIIRNWIKFRFGDQILCVLFCIHSSNINCLQKYNMSTKRYSWLRVYCLQKSTVESMVCIQKDTVINIL